MLDFFVGVFKYVEIWDVFLFNVDIDLVVWGGFESLDFNMFFSDVVVVGLFSFIWVMRVRSCGF